MNEVQTTKKLLAITALIFVAATLISLPYQNQVANAAPTKTYQIRVTLTNVPANTGALEVNATMLKSIPPPFISVSETPVKTVSSPSSGDIVKFTLKVPAGSDEGSVFVCSNTLDFRLSACDVIPLPTSGGGPIKVNHTPRSPF